MVQFIRKHSKEGEIDMKHLIIVKFKENVWARESEASREMLADIREILRSDEADRRRPYSEHL